MAQRAALDIPGGLVLLCYPTSVPPIWLFTAVRWMGMAPAVAPFRNLLAHGCPEAVKAEVAGRVQHPI
jgi:hypothetical protein